MKFGAPSKIDRSQSSRTYRNGKMFVTWDGTIESRNCAAIYLIEPKRYVYPVVQSK